MDHPDCLILTSVSIKQEASSCFTVLRCQVVSISTHVYPESIVYLILLLVLRYTNIFAEDSLWGYHAMINSSWNTIIDDDIICRTSTSPQTTNSHSPIACISCTSGHIDRHEFDINASYLVEPEYLVVLPELVIYTRGNCDLPLRRRWGQYPTPEHFEPAEQSWRVFIDIRLGHLDLNLVDTFITLSSSESRDTSYVSSPATITFAI